MRIKNLYQNRVKLGLLFYLFTFLPLALQAEDGHELWLRYRPVNQAKVTGPECIAAQELRTYYQGENANLVIDPTLEEGAYRIDGSTITAKNDIGLLYGAYALLRRQGDRETGRQGDVVISKPFYKLRILNHWDNLNGTIERGYAGLSIFWKGKPGERTFRGRTIFIEDPDQPIDTALIIAYSGEKYNRPAAGLTFFPVHLMMITSF